MNDKPRLELPVLRPQPPSPDWELQQPLANQLYSVATIGGQFDPINDVVIPGECADGRTVIEHKPSENGKPASAMIDLSRTRFVVTAWPDHRWPLEITRWIEGLMRGVTPVQPDYRASVKKKNVECARNWAIKNDALGSHEDYQWFVFLDRDVRPCNGIETSRFLVLDADVKNCQVKHGTVAPYSWPNDFHEPIWCTSRRVLESIEPPWFVQGYNEDHTEMAGCICQSFRKKVLDAGFTIAHGGWADHDRDGSWCG